jgi:hypothetical protein
MVNQHIAKFHDQNYHNDIYIRTPQIYYKYKKGEGLQW